MEVATGDDDAVFKFVFASGADEAARSGAFMVAGFFNWRVETEFAGVGEGDFYLSVGAGGAEDGDVVEDFSRADDAEAVGGEKFGGLGESFGGREFVAFTKEEVDEVLGEVNVAGGDFDRDGFSNHVVGFDFVVGVAGCGLDDAEAHFFVNVDGGRVVGEDGEVLFVVVG